MLNFNVFRQYGFYFYVLWVISGICVLEANRWSKLMKLLRLLQAGVRDKSGATAIEFGLMASLVAIAVAGGMSAAGHNVNDRFSSVNEAFSATSSSSSSTR